MKTAYELAMARLGGEVREYSDAQKQELAEVDKVHDAKAAQAKLAADTRRAAAAGDAEKLAQVNQDLVVELASIESQRERKKTALRDKFGSP